MNSYNTIPLIGAKSLELSGWGEVNFDSISNYFHICRIFIWIIGSCNLFAEKQIDDLLRWKSFTISNIDIPYENWTKLLLFLYQNVLKLLEHQTPISPNPNARNSVANDNRLEASFSQLHQQQAVAVNNVSFAIILDGDQYTTVPPSPVNRGIPTFFHLANLFIKPMDRLQVIISRSLYRVERSMRTPHDTSSNELQLLCESYGGL